MRANYIEMDLNTSLCSYICSSIVQWKISRNQSWSLLFGNYTI